MNSNFLRDDSSKSKCLHACQEKLYNVIYFFSLLVFLILVVIRCEQFGGDVAVLNKLGVANVLLLEGMEE